MNAIERRLKSSQSAEHVQTHTHTHTQRSAIFTYAQQPTFNPINAALDNADVQQLMM